MQEKSIYLISSKSFNILKSSLNYVLKVIQLTFNFPE